MSEVIYLDASRFTGSLQSGSTETAEAGPRVFVREIRSNIWLVHDEDDTKGGCFRNRQTAFRFVEEEFGPEAQVVVQPRFPAQAPRVSHIKQSTSIAHRAIAAH
jgi:hypothetical protein